MMADIAFAGDLDVRGVIELHSSHRRALQKDGALRSALRQHIATIQNENQKTECCCQ